jgi:hypothetical protein
MLRRIQSIEQYIDDVQGFLRVQAQDMASRRVSVDVWPSKPLPEEPRIWYRGQRKKRINPPPGAYPGKPILRDYESFSLIPGILRNSPLPGSPLHDERSLIHIFKLRAQSRYRKCPRRRDYPGWLFLMQHYGLPTRLLDWTASALVALYFAVEDRRENPFSDRLDDAEVIALDRAMLYHFELADKNDQSELIADPLEAKVRSSSKEGWADPWGAESNVRYAFDSPFADGPAFGPDVSDVPAGRVLPIKPVELDPRVMVQKSRFTIHGRSGGLEDHPLVKSGKETILKRFDIAGERRGQILKQLHDLGYTRMALFPDLDNLGEDLTRFGPSIDR